MDSHTPPEPGLYEDPPCRFLSRRDFLACAGAAVGSSCKSPEPAPRTPAARQPVILVHSDTVAAAAGLLRLLDIHVPEASVMLWTERLEAEPVLRRYFARLRLGGQASEALQSADFLVDSSRPLDAARVAAGKPYAMFGITFTNQDALDSALAVLFRGAEFVYTRDTKSLANIRRAGISRPVTGCAPDAALSYHLSNDPAAKAFLGESRLEPKRFITVAPGGPHQQAGNAKLRDAIITWVRRTGYQVLLCGQSQAELYDPLPADIKPKVARRRTEWLVGEEASVYRRSIAVVSLEEGAPVIAAANDTPCVYVQPPEDATNGQMWKDIGLAGWCLEMEQTSGLEIADRLVKIHNEYAVSQVTVHEAVIYARKLQSVAMDTLRSALKK